MANILQLRKGNSAQNRGFLGSVGELTYDTELDRLRVHNGTTVGGKVIVGTRIVTTPIDANHENTTGVRIINGVGNTNLPLDVYGALNVYSNENFAIGALRVYQTFQPDIFNDLFFRKWDGWSWSAWERALKSSEKNTEAFGVGQTWQDVTASRAKNVTYTNTTGKVILVNVCVLCTDDDDGQTVTVGGIRVGYSSGYQSSGTGAWNNTITFIVPNLESYVVSGGSGIVFWVELR